MLLDVLRPVFGAYLCTHYTGARDREILRAAPTADLLRFICALDARMVFQGPRQVVSSKAVNRNPATLRLLEGYKYLLQRIRKGDDLTPHLSHRLPSLEEGQERQDAAFKCDVLLETWGIYHLHIPKRVPPRKRDLRNNAIVYCCFGRGVAVVLDVREKHDFRPEPLLDVLIDEFSETNLVHKLQGAVGLARKVTETDRRKLAMNGINSGYERNGAVFMGVRGLASDMSGIHNTMRADAFSEHVEHVETSGLLFEGSADSDPSALEGDFLDHHFGITNKRTLRRYKLPFEFSYGSPISAASNG